ncbi:MAG: hypothetical protein HQM08_03975 [Candidatus Riflebacteria bacterium]|nr:hypothetical protein [Candidatus Riflebacteria bacterium]
MPVSTKLILTGLSAGVHSLKVVGIDALRNLQSHEDATIFTWTIDITGKVAVLSNTPANPTNQTSATITVGGIGVVRYSYSIDNGPWSAEAPIPTALSLSGLSVGEHTLKVVGIDALGNQQSHEDATSFTWTIDTTQKVAVLSNTPANPTNQTSATISVGGPSVSKYSYSLDDSPWSAETPISTKLSLANLVAGVHTLKVVSEDAIGNLQSQEAATSITWKIDLAVKVAMLSNIPANFTNQTTAVITVGGIGVVKYSYSLDNGPWSPETPVSTSLSLSNLSSGVHFLKVVGIDALGISQSHEGSTSISWTIDNTPKVAVLSNTPANPTNVTVAKITVGGTGVVKYSYSLDDSPWSAETPVSTTLSLTGLSSGEHKLKVVGIDALGNLQSQEAATSLTWTIDTTPKVVILNNTPANPTNQTVANITVGGTGVVKYSYSLDNGPWSPETPVSTTLSLQGLADVAHTLKVVGIDTLGNLQSQEAATSIPWTIDSIAKVAVLSNEPANPTNQTGAMITVGGTDVVKYSYSLDNSAWTAESPVSTQLSLQNLAAGSHTLKVVGKDALGNLQSQEAATSITWTIDQTAKVAVLINTPENFTNQTVATITVGGSGVVKYSYNLDDGAWSTETPVSTPLSLKGLSSGAHTLKVIGIDGLGNLQSQGGATSVTWTIDTTAKVAVLTNTPTNLTNQTTALITVGGAGVTKYSYSLDDGPWSAETPVSTTLSLKGFSSGVHKLKVIGIDTLGNLQSQEGATIFNWTIDTIPKVALLSNLPANLTNQTSAAITVGGTGVLKYSYSLDGGAWIAETLISTKLSFSGLASGVHMLKVIGIDALGNLQSQESATIFNWTIDTAPKVASLINTPTNLTNQTTALITVGGTGVVKYSYSLDDGPWSAETLVSNGLNLQSLVFGVHTLKVIGIDALGNLQSQEAATSITWAIDTMPKVALLSNSPANLTNQTTAAITVGGTGVVKYSFSLDNGPWSNETPVSTTLKLSDLAVGAHTLKVVGIDGLGNLQSQEFATTITWSIDNVAKVASLRNAPANPTNQTTAAITVGGTGVTKYSYSFDNGAWSAEIPVSTQLSLSGLSTGTHFLKVVGIDALGNSQSQEGATNITWTIDTTPKVALLSNTPANPTNQTTATITIGGTGVEKYSYNLDGGAWSAEIPVSTPLSVTGLSSGVHTL